jgi:pilus assembly protein CpaD
MKKIATWTVLALASSLAGCSGSAYGNRSLESVHQPVVSNTILQFDVAARGGDLPPSEQARLQGWFDAMGLRYGDRVAIEDPSLYGATAAQSAIRAMVERRGLLMSTDVPVTTGGVPSGHVRVTIARASAHVPGCPDWATKYSANIVNATSSNYGCATNSNLAAMVADPNDLIKGARNEGSDPAAATRPINTFRTKPQTGVGDLKASSTSGSNGGSK